MSVTTLLLIIGIAYCVVTFGTYLYLTVRVGDQEQAAKYTRIAISGFTISGAVGILLVALMGSDAGPNWPWLMFGPSFVMAIILWYMFRTEPAEISRAPFATVFAGVCCSIPILITMVGLAMLILGH